MLRATRSTSSCAAGTAPRATSSTSSRATTTSRRSSCWPIADKNPAGAGVYFVRGDATECRGPGAGRHRVRLGRDRLPVRRIGRGGHALDPGDHGHQVRRAPGPHGGRGQQPASRAAFPARRGRRAARHVQDGVAPAGPLRAVPGPVLARDRHRVRRRGLRALPDHAARRVSRAVRSTGLGPAARRPPRRRCCRSIAAAAPFVNPPERLRARGRRRRVVVAETLGDARTARDAATCTSDARAPPRRCPAPDPALGDPATPRAP